MVESKEEVLVKEERWPGVTPAVIPPLIFLSAFRERLGNPLYSWF
jgi:hypothetical protein